MAWLLRAYRELHFPPDAFLFNGTRIGNILIYVTPFFPSVPFGLLIGNFLLWCIPQAREATEPETPGGEHPRFQATQFALARLGGVLSAIALPVCFLGANNFWAVTPSRIDYRPLFSFATRHYAWSDVEEVETECYISKNSATYRFVVRLNNGTGIDLMEESPRGFVAVYPEIQAALRSHPYEFSSWKFTGPCAVRAPRRWREILSQRPTE